MAASDRDKTATGRSDEENIRRLSDSRLVRNLSDIQLTRRIERFDTKERELTLSILHHLGELDRRRLYLRQGYSSMFDFCMRHLDYSEAAAGRRIRAARAIRDYPEVARRYASREVSVTTISRIAGIITGKNCERLLDAVAGRRKNDVEMIVSRFRPRERIIEKVRPVFVLDAVPADPVADPSGAPPGQGHTSIDPDRPSDDAGDRRIHDEASTDHDVSCSFEGGRSSTTAGGGKNSCSPACDIQGGRDSGAAHSGMSSRKILSRRLKYRLEFGIDPDLMEKIEQVKSLLSTKYPGNVSLEQLLAELIDEYLDRHSPEARNARREKRKASSALRNPDGDGAGGKPQGPGPAGGHPPKREQAPPNRHIPRHVRDEIYSRDGGRCAFVGPDGIRCGSRWNLQIDHIRPFSKGGDHSPENLRLLCARHNRSEAERHLGIGKMKKFVKRE